MKHYMAAACLRVGGGWVTSLSRFSAGFWLVAALMLPLAVHAGPDDHSALATGAAMASTSPPEADNRASAGAQDAPPLTVLFRGNRPRHAVVLLAGIYNDHEYFRPWQGSFTSEDVLLLGWVPAHHVQRLDDTDRLLARELMHLHEQGIRTVTLLAHSIGGLIAKGTVDRLTREGLADRFDVLELHAFGTPWGGFPGADLAHTNPLGHLVSYLARNPAWLDLGTHSDYLAALARPMPPNGRLFNYFSVYDEVALPGTDAAAQRYQALLQHASVSVRVSGDDHTAYVRHPIDWLLRFARERSMAEQMAKRTTGRNDISANASE